MTATAVPRLADLGSDLLVTTGRRRALALALPYLGLAAFAVAAWRHWWWLTPVIVFLTFVAVVTVTHDVVHRSLGLGRRSSNWALFLLGLVTKPPVAGTRPAPRSLLRQRWGTPPARTVRLVPARTENRDRIVRATVQTLATEGYAATTARSVARTGGFAPGVIYYHFDDLEDLLVAAAQYTGETRLARYREELSGVTSATELLERLEQLRTEDVADGHIAAVQELTAASSSSPKLAAGIRAQIEPWQDFAEEIAGRFVTRTPFAALIPIPELARAAVALFLGLEMLSHLDTDRARSDSFFTSARPAAALFDLMASAPGDA